jgi:hypothetical protein
MDGWINTDRKKDRQIDRQTIYPMTPKPGACRV